MKFTELKMYTPSLHTISGQTGSGKTATCFSIADVLHRKTKKHIYLILGELDRPIEEYKLPSHIHSLKPGAEHPLDSVIIGDDWQRIAPARRAMADVNVLLDTLMGTLRHDNIDYILDVQTYASLDRNSVIRTDYRWYKKPYMSEAEFARPEIRREAEEAEEVLIRAPLSAAYLSSRNREGFEGEVTGIPLPSYWSSDLSTLHRRLTQEEREQRRPPWQRFNFLGA